ncbi:hypothetical protein BC828DRAFT_376645 [Blastocladiella britannica]|nr:hypothetical protein BC828DRAFT_376645 [Blastocladiella britannica]
MHLPNEILDRILVLAVAYEAHGLVRRAVALTVVDAPAVRSILGVAGTLSAIPTTASVAVLLLPHCTVAAAARHTRLDILKLRRSLGSLHRADELDADPRLPLVEASGSGSIATVEWLLEHVKVSTRAEVEARAMGSASAARSVHMLEFWCNQNQFSEAELARTYWSPVQPRRPYPNSKMVGGAR